MNYKLSFLILVLMVCPLTLLGKQKDDFLEIKNKILTVRQDLTRGGAICFVGRMRQTRNYVNIFDEGRYIQQSYYAGKSINRQEEGQSPFWSPWPWNPIQVGDYKRNRAQILESHYPSHIYLTHRDRHISLGFYD